MLQASTLANVINGRRQRDDLINTTMQRLHQAAGGKLSADVIKQTAKDFEALFVTQMLDHMFGGESMGESLFGNGETDEIYQSMMVEEYGKAIVKGGGMGIAEHIERTLTQRAMLQAQEV